MSVVWLNGSLVDAGHARISVLDRGLLSGYGLFETFRAYDGRPWGLDEHYARLRAGGELIGLEVPAADVLRAATSETLKANALDDAGVRVTITGGTGPVDVQADPDGAPSVIVIAWALRDYTELYTQGASLVTLAEGGRPLAGVKTTSYAISVAGRVFANRAGADDAIFLGPHKRVLEATGSNLMVVKGAELRTPPLEDAILPGITRRYVMDVATGEGYDVSEDVLYIDDLLSADEVVLTSSLREVYPARSVDGQPLKIAGHATRLREAYERFVQDRLR